MGLLEEISAHWSSARLFIDTPQIRGLRQGGTVWLAMPDRPAAGAIGKERGEALARALESLQDDPPGQLNLLLNSAGAHFNEPLQGLIHLNRWLNALRALKYRDARITVFSDGWLFGGSAMTVAACADELCLLDEAQMGLFGHSIQQERLPAALPRPEAILPPCLSMHRLGKEALQERLAEANL